MVVITVNYSCFLTFLYKFHHIFFHTTWYHFLFRPAWAGGRGGWRGTFYFAVLLSLSSRYYSSNVAKQTASLGLVLSVLSLYSFILIMYIGMTDFYGGKVERGKYNDDDDDDDDTECDGDDNDYNLSVATQPSHLFLHSI